MRLPPETRTRLLAELDRLAHLTRAEQSIRHTARVNGTVKRSDIRDLIADLERLSPRMQPTPTEGEIIRIHTANQR